MFERKFLGTLDVIFHVIYKFQFCLADNVVLWTKICQNLDPFSDFLNEFRILQENSVSWKNCDVFYKKDSGIKTSLIASSEVI